MEPVSKPTKRNPGEFKRFLVSGSSAVAMDTTTYWLLLAIQLTPSCAKAISFIAGTLVAYVLNKFWTFKKPHRSHAEVVKFITLYLSTLGANVMVNRLTLDWAAVILPFVDNYKVQLAFLAATGTSTILNYLGQKYWVFKPANVESESAMPATENAMPASEGE